MKNVINLFQKVAIFEKIMLHIVLKCFKRKPNITCLIYIRDIFEKSYEHHTAQ